jgi:hypothetical protein
VTGFLNLPGGRLLTNSHISGREATTRRGTSRLIADLAPLTCSVETIKRRDFGKSEDWPPARSSGGTFGFRTNIGIQASGLSWGLQQPGSVPGRDRMSREVRLLVVVIGQRDKFAAWAKTYWYESKKIEPARCCGSLLW